MIRFPLPLVLGLVLASAAPAAAQVRPDLAWRTLTTAHFRIHYTVEVEALARRTAVNAEEAWARLSEELVPPRGPVDIVVADNMDFANGYATMFPTNRIVIYARPPVELMALRNHADWNRLLVTHELVHVFQLDRARGAWALAQRLFGRAAPLFPHGYAPSWILEGLAVHYETRFGGGGRLAGTEFPMYVRAAARAGELPSLDALSLATPQFPGGDRTYVFGSYAVSRADTARMGRFVEAGARRLLPWRHDRNAEDAFGASFSARWAAWRDSVARAEAGLALADDPRTVLTRHGFTARFPRFVADDALLYVANDARAVTGLYRLTLDGARDRVGRRNSIDVSAPARDGGTVQGELDFRDPYSMQGDLYRGSGRRRRRLTRGERLSSPDVHAPSGRVVAVRTDPGTTSLVVLEAEPDPVPRELVRGTLDRTWAEPRWSRGGDRVAAVRWERGGRNAVVVLGNDGTVQRTFAPRGPRLTIVSAPAWEPGDSTLLFVSDHEGRPMVYRGDVRTGAYGRVWASATGLNTPDVSPDGRRVAAVELRADGYHVVARENPGPVPLALPAADTLPDPLRPLVAASEDTMATAGRYDALAQLRPRWWLPVIGATDPGTSSFGFMTSSYDVVGRHAWSAEVALEPRREEVTSRLTYAWAGLGVPVLLGEFTNEWDHFAVRDGQGAFAGWLGQRSQRTSVHVLFERPRVRFSSYLLVGGEAEGVRFRSYPRALLPQLNNGALLGTTWTQALQATAGFSSLMRAANGVSPQDGLAGYVTHRQRYGLGIAYQDITETIASLDGMVSLPLPGFARHVLAAHAAYGVTGHATTAALDVGGVSGSSLEVLPGVVIGGSRRAFGVRGFPGGTLLGARAAAGSVEYRAPLALVGRGLGLLPLYLQKTTLTAFADAGSAWCEFAVAQSFVCRDPLPPRTTIASVGGELGFDASLTYDRVYRFRLGLAHPVRGAALARQANTFYFTLGSAF